MADSDLPNLIPASPLADTDLFYVVQGASPFVSRKATGAQLKTYAGGGGGSTVQDITTGAVPIDLVAPFADFYVISTGGTATTETINLPAYGVFADSNVGQRISFEAANYANVNDLPTLSYTGNFADVITFFYNGSAVVFPIFTVECDGINWYPVGWSQSGALPSALFSYAQGGSAASGVNSHAEGSSTATGADSHSEGNAHATGPQSHAEGGGTASGISSHAEGTATASGDRSHAEGFQTVASGANTHVEGDRSCADAINSQATGSQSWTRGILTAQAYSSGAQLTLGDSQVIRICLLNQTSDASPTTLTTDNGGPHASNQLALLDNETVFADVAVLGKTAGAADFMAWHGEVVIQRGAGAASTAIPVSTPTSPVVLSQYASAGAISGSWSVALSADTTSGALSVTVIGDAINTVNWVAEVRSRELVF